MMMTDPKTDMLDDLFATARRVQPDPGADLTARVLADARRARHRPVAAPQPGLLAQLAAMIGGWPAFGGLAAATVAGIWVGIAPPPVVEDYAFAIWGQTVAIDLFAEDLLDQTGDGIDG
jgi:hypothetical protein